MNPILRLLNMLHSGDPAFIQTELARFEAVQRELESKDWHLQLDLAQGLADCLALATEAAHVALDARVTLEEAAQAWSELQDAVQGCESLLVGQV